jgi:hypothetical protein
MNPGIINWKSNVYNPILSSVNEEVHAPLTDGSGPSSDIGDNTHLVGITTFRVRLDPRFSFGIYRMVPYRVPRMSCVMVSCESGGDFLEIRLDGVRWETGFLGVLTSQQFEDLVSSLLEGTLLDDLVSDKQYHLIFLIGVLDHFRRQADRTELGSPNLFLIDVSDVVMLDLLYNIGVHNHLDIRERREVLKLIIKKEHLHSLQWYLDKVRLMTDENPFDIDPCVLLYSFERRKLKVFDFLTRQETFLSVFWRESYRQDILPYNSIDFFLSASKLTRRHRMGWVQMFDYLLSKRVTVGGEIVNLFRIERDHQLTQRIIDKLVQSYGQVQNTFIVRLARFGFLLNGLMEVSYRAYWHEKLYDHETQFRLYCATFTRRRIPRSLGLSKREIKKFHKELKCFRLVMEDFRAYGVASIVFEFLCGCHYSSLHYLK